MSHAPAGQRCNCGLRGWMPGVEHAPIRWGMNAYNERTDMQPVAIVDHIMQGYLNTMVQWTTTGASKVIVHFGIGQGGRVVQMHPIFSPGIHASSWNHGSSYTSPTVKARSASPNSYTVGIEHEGCSVDPRPAYTVPPSLIYSRGNPWPEPMVEASIRVKRWCFAQAPSLGIPSRTSIIGHYETGDANRVNDPASASDRSVWPRDRMIAALAPVKAAPKEKAVALTAEQQYVVDEIRRQRSTLTEAQIADALADVGLDAMPGEEPAAPTSAPVGTPSTKRAEIEADLDEAAEALMRASAALNRARLKNRSA